MEKSWLALLLCPVKKWEWFAEVDMHVSETLEDQKTKVQNIVQKMSQNTAICVSMKEKQFFYVTITATCIYANTLILMKQSRKRI